MGGPAGDPRSGEGEAGQSRRTVSHHLEMSAIMTTTRTVALGLSAAAALLLTRPTSSSAQENGKKQALEGSALLSYLRDLPSIDTFVQQLGDSRFAKRERATRKLTELGIAALPALRRAAQSSDKEVASRAKDCIAQIERERKGISALKIVQLLIQQQPAGTMEALLHYLPHAQDNAVDEVIYFGLCDRLERGESLRKPVVAALTDKSPVRRALAGLLVGRFGTGQQREAAHRLLADENQEVRLRTAQGLLAGGVKASLPTLIALLEKAPLGVAWQAEELLHYAAGEDSPKAVIGTGTEQERVDCHTAWKAWWREKGPQLNLAVASMSNRRPRLVLAFEEAPETGAYLPLKKDKNGKVIWNGRIWLCGCDGQVRGPAYHTFKEFTATHLPLGSDRLTVVSGHRESGRFQDLGLILPERKEWGDVKGEYRPQFVASLGNGQRIVAIESPVPRLAELDPKGRTVWEACFAEDGGGMVFLPLVRAGFPPLARPVDLDSPTQRLKALKSPLKLVRLLAISSLEKVRHNEETFRGVVDALEHDDPRVREGAAKILAKLADVDVLVLANLAERDEEGPRASKAIPNLIRRFDDSDVRVRRAAERALIGCGSKAAPALLKVLEQDKSPMGSERRACAAAALTWLLPTVNVKIETVVRRLFSDKDPHVREIVVRMLAGKMMLMWKSHRAFLKYAPEMVRALGDSDDTVVKTADIYISQFGKAAEGGVPHLLKALKDPERRERAIYNLTEIGRNHPQVLPALLVLLTPDQDAGTCVCVAGALEKFSGSGRDQLIVPALRQLLQDRRRSLIGKIEVRSCAVSALGHFGIAAKPALKDLLQIAKESPGSDLSQKAMRAIERIAPQMGLKNPKSSPQEQRPAVKPKRT